MHKNKMHKTQNLRDLLTELARTRDFEPKMLEQKVFFLWRKHLGTPLGTKTMPVSISGGTLKIYTEYPPYKNEISLLKDKIIADLNAELGQPILTDIRIDVRQSVTSTSLHTSVSETGAEPLKATPNTSPESPPHEPTPETLEQIDQTVADVTDTDLKASLHQLFISQSRDKS